MADYVVQFPVSNYPTDCRNFRNIKIVPDYGLIALTQKELTKKKEKFRISSKPFFFADR